MVGINQLNMEDEEKKCEVYNTIKSKVITILEKKTKVEDLKAYFQRDIESPRALSKAKTVSDVIKLLEERDVLNPHCILPLYYLGKFLEEEDIVKLTSLYKRCYLNDNEAICFCGIPYKPPKLQKIIADVGNSIDPDLKFALKTLSRRIGEHWPVLISELNVFESQIDLVYKLHPKDYEDQAYQALLYWVQNEKENATLEALDKALNARLCKMKGIGSHLRQPIADVV